jgi:hypothetical protein
MKRNDDVSEYDSFDDGPETPQDSGPLPFDEQLPGEKVVPYKAFRDYCLMGVTRSLRKLVKSYQMEAKAAEATRGSGRSPDGQETVQIPPTVHRKTLERWADRYAWKERVREFDKTERMRELEMWHGEQDQWLRRMWQLNNGLLDQAEKMMRHPLTVKKTRRTEIEEGGGMVKVIEITMPTNWRASDVARYLKTANEIGSMVLVNQLGHIEADDGMDRIPTVTFVEDADVTAPPIRADERGGAPGTGDPPGSGSTESEAIPGTT